MKQELVSVTDTLERLGYSTNLKAERVLELAKQLHIDIIAEVPAGRGVFRMMTKAQAEDLIKKSEDQTKPAPRTSGSEDPQLHIFRLEEQVKAMVAEMRGMRETFELFQKASNIQADRLAKVLEQLA